MNITFGTPEHGWLEVQLADKQTKHHLDASDVPCNSLESLVSAVLKLHNGSVEEEIEWSLEPSYEVWKFKVKEEKITLIISIDDKEKAVFISLKNEVIKSFYEALTKLGSLESWNEDIQTRQSWTWDFPTSTLNKLKEKIEV